MRKTFFSCISLMLFVYLGVPCLAQASLPGPVPFYTGYYDDAGYGVDYTSEVAGNTNTIWIRENDDNPSSGIYATSATQSIRILNELKTSYPGVKAIIDVAPVFFNPTTFLLYSNFQDRWNTYVQNLALNNFNNQYAGFYSLDEAYANGYGQGIPFAQMKTQLENVSALVKSSFPNLPLLLSFTPSTVSLPIPIGYDWVSVDCHGYWTDCDGTGTPMATTLNTLQNSLGPNQYMFLSADGDLEPGVPNNTNQQSALIGRAKHYFSWAQTHSQVVAVFPFLWQSIPSINIVGTRDMPTVKNAMNGFFTSLANNTPILAELEILNSGRGCSDNNCIWMIVRNVNSDFRVDIRTVANNSTTPNWIVYQNSMVVTPQPDGTTIITFRISDSTAINELNTNGLNFWLVNPINQEWTNPNFIH